MATVRKNHKKALEQICPANWADFDVWAGLLSNISTAEPQEADVAVQTLDPAINEFPVERLQLTGKSHSWNAIDSIWENVADVLFWDAVTGDLTRTGVSGIFFFVREPSNDDTENWLVTTVLFDEVVDVDGGSLTVSYDESGLIYVSSQGV